MKSVLCALALVASLPSLAFADAFLSMPAKNVKLQNYAGDAIMLWNTGSPCTSQNIATARLSAADKNRLFATVLSAKAAGQNIYVYYDIGPNSSECQLNSFGIDTGN